ncbi:hypothetical protein ABE073_03955 [Lederbergia citrisecunda]|uniref:hypothetical protein n=1 Tax=Lederbergia citrisecunda TaxID=2833583 RepID=UPI003D2CD440
MGTPFSDIYNLFLSQIKDYELAEMEETVLEDNLQLWLMGAIPYFHSCKKDLELLDKTIGSFNAELNIKEQNILSIYMVHSYVSTFLLREENLSQALNSKDYRMYSPANQLKALQSLCEDIRRKGSTLQSQYSWNVHSLKEMFKK